MLLVSALPLWSFKKQAKLITAKFRAKPCQDTCPSREKQDQRQGERQGGGESARVRERERERVVERGGLTERASVTAQIITKLLQCSSTRCLRRDTQDFEC